MGLNHAIILRSNQRENTAARSLGPALNHRLFKNRTGKGMKDARRGDATENEFRFINAINLRSSSPSPPSVGCINKKRIRQRQVRVP